MNRFYFSEPNKPFLFGEFQLQAQEGVRIYDGDIKTRYENGELVLTSHRIIWTNPGVGKCQLCLPLQFVYLIEEDAGSFTKSPKLVLHLSDPLPGSESRPDHKSGQNFVRFSFKSGGEKEFSRKLHDALKQRQWDIKPAATRSRPTASQQKKIRSGIGGIEKHMQQKIQKTNKDISKAFQDLDKLMEMAKPMVELAKSISGKIRERQGEVSDDETIQFKSYLLSMGISDPVTRDSHGSGQIYYMELAKEVFRILEQPVKDSGGMMTLTDAFCRVNRARGLELLSPEDLLQACKTLPKVPLPLEIHTFPETGVIVLQDPSKSSTAEIHKRTMECLDQNGSLTSEELSRAAGISVVLAKERLLAAEKEGDACRDDSIQGLRFYPNKFLK